MKKKIILLSLFSLWLTMSAFSQVDTSWINQMNELENQFNEYENSVQNEFDKFVEKNDKQFSSFLEKSWKEVELQKGMIKKETKPKPVVKPEIKKTEIVQVETKPIVIEPIKEEIKIKPVVNYVPITPGIQKRGKKEFITASNTFEFYGTNVAISYDESLKKPFSGDLIPKNIAAYWTTLSEAEHYKTVNELLDIKKYMQLPDWGFLKLVESFSHQVFPTDKNSATMLSWFLLNKSRYKARLAYSRITAYLLIPSQDVVYRTRYYTFDNIRFYLFDNDAPKVYTYEKDYPDAKIYMSLSIDKPILLHKDLVTKQFSFYYDEQLLKYSATYNKNLINFYAEYPPTDVSVNFNAPLSEVTYQSFINNIQPLIAGKSKIEAANILLALGQKSFEYKTDQDQFGYEKYFFAEELFHYPASDCEDRSVLFSKLANNLLQRETIGLKYPGHMATALMLPELKRGDYVQAEGKKFYVADATFENAPVGICMSQFRAVHPKVIQTKILRSLEPSNFLQNFESSNSNLAVFSEGIQHSANGDIIVPGTFSKSISYGGKTFTAEGINTFIAHFSATGDLKWLKTVLSNAPNYPKQVAVQKGKIYVNGIFSNTIKLDGKTLTSIKPEHFVAVIDENTGNTRWIKSLDLANAKKQGDYIYAARLSASGELSAMMFYDRKDYFDNFGFKIYADGSLAVSNSFYGIPESTAFASGSNNSFVNAYSLAIKKASDISMNKDFIQIASIFTGLRIFGKNTTGQQILTGIKAQSTDFSSQFPELFKELNYWSTIEKDADNFKIHSTNDFQINNLLFGENMSFTVGEYSSGNVFVEFSNGLWFYNNSIKYKVNNLLFNSKTGQLFIDYSTNHYRGIMNLTDF